MKITVEALVNAPVTRVWSAYTTADDIKQWNTTCDWHTTQSSVDLRVGGAFSSRMETNHGSFRFDFSGSYTKIVPNELNEFSFGERAASSVEFVTDAKGVTLRVTFDAETEYSVEQQRQGWQAILDNFAEHVLREPVTGTMRSCREKPPPGSWACRFEAYPNDYLV